jgi:hypothetical protein
LNAGIKKLAATSFARGPQIFQCWQYASDLPDGASSHFNETATTKIRKIETAFADSGPDMKMPAAGLPVRAV